MVYVGFSSWYCALDTCHLRTQCFMRIVLQKEAALSPWYMAAGTQPVTGTETHLSGWLSYELGDWGRMGMLVPKLGFGLRASSFPASVIGKTQILQVSSLKLQDPLSSVGNSPKHTKRITKDNPWVSRLHKHLFPPSTCRGHLMGFGQLWLLGLSQESSRL